MRKVSELMERLVQQLGRSGIPADQWSTLPRVRELLDYARRIEPFAKHGNLRLCDPASERARDFEAALARIHELETTLAGARKGTVGWKQKLSPFDVDAALEQAKQWQGRFFAWLSPAWWRLRGVLHRSYDFRGHAVRPTWTHILTSLQQEHAAAAELEQASETTKTRFSLDRRPQEIQSEAGTLREQLSHLPAWLARIHAALVRSASSESIVARTLAADDTARDAAQSLDQILVDYGHLTIDELRRYLADIGSAVRQVPQALSVLGEMRNLPPAIGRTLREMPFTISQAEAAVAGHTWESLTLADRELSRFNGRLRDRHAQRLETAYDAWLGANAAEVCQRVKKAFLENVRTSNLAASQLSPEQKEFKKSYSQGRRMLEHEFGKTMRYRAIRELVDGEAGLVVRDLRPVWLMSPLSVSDTLPLRTDFVDVVIFDEASQVPLEESVPSLFRGQQVIVVGDEMQLPPTDFFSSRSTHDEDDPVANGEESLDHELESDSFLNHSAKNLPATMLGWHYRSRSESLISFSNWAFYDGRLLTVPDHRLANGKQTPMVGSEKDGDSGLEKLLGQPLSFHLLKGSVYDQRRNRGEAEYIARLVAELLKRRLGLSVGVIAFSEAQQDEIESALRRLAQDDDEFQSLYEEELEREIDGQFVGLLVKNLENIQGDERDIVILSICYGPGPNGKMLMNFGPINKSGGEKRLNVAFSRAKQYMAVISSIQQSQITNDYNEGANALKSYLRYAEAVSQGDADAARRVLATVTRWQEPQADLRSDSGDSVVAQLADLLRKRGYQVDEAIGQSHFRVDLAVRRSEDPTYRVGILVDTPGRQRTIRRARNLATMGRAAAVVRLGAWRRCWRRIGSRTAMASWIVLSA